MDFVNVRDYGTHADGIHDDSETLNNLIKRGIRKLLIPEGRYIFHSALILKSGTQIKADKNAVIGLAAGAQKGRHDFLVTVDFSQTAENILISGGIWNGNSMQNDRGDDLFDPNATSGALFSFRNVRNLTLSDMTLKNPLCYYLRFCEAENVRIENTVFESEDLHINQDGIHLAGFCSNFIIRNLRGAGGSPGDDFIALNADDCLTRQESFDMINGPQRDILIENIHADECHCFVRLLSVRSPIENVTIRNITGSCRGTAINMDAARYCRVPLFEPGDSVCADGVGSLKNILIENVNVKRSQVTGEQYITAETNAERLEIRNFTAATPCEAPVIKVANLAGHRLIYKSAGGKTEEILAQNSTRAFEDLSFDSFVLEKV